MKIFADKKRTSLCGKFVLYLFKLYVEHKWQRVSNYNSFRISNLVLTYAVRCAQQFQRSWDIVSTPQP